MAEAEIAAALAIFEPDYLPAKYFGAVESICRRKGWLAPLISASDAASDVDVSNICVIFSAIVNFQLRPRAPQTRIYIVIQDNFDVIGCMVGRLSKNEYAIILTMAGWVAGHMVALDASRVPAARAKFGLPEMPIDPKFPDKFTFDSFGDAEVEVDRRMGAALSTVGLIFLLFHEAGHVINGHLDRHNSFDYYIDELEANAIDSSTISKTLEWDADGFAMAQTFRWMFLSKRKIDTLGELSEKSAIRLLGVGAACFFAGVVCVTGRDMAAEGSTHPSTAFRLFSFLRTLEMAIEQLYPGNEEMTSVMNEVDGLVAEIWDPIFLRETGISFVGIVKSSQFLSETRIKLREMNLCWKSLRPGLTPLVHGNYELAP